MDSSAVTLAARAGSVFEGFRPAMGSERAKLAGDRGRAATRIGAGPARAVGPDAHGAHCARAPLELGPLGDGVAESGERVASLARDPPLDLHLAGAPRVGPERAGEAARRAPDGRARRAALHP